MAKRAFFNSRLIYVLGVAGFLVMLGFGWYVSIVDKDILVFGELVNSIDTQEKIIALTVDDVPTENTSGILDILDELNVQATFFVVGRQLERFPDIAQRMVSEGHQIGNHSYSHYPMVFKSVDFISFEVEKTDSLIRQIGYTGKIYFRPPFGKKGINLAWYLNQQDRTMVNWSIAPERGYTSSTKEIVTYILEHAKPGSIVLIHPLGTSVNAIPGIVKGLVERGYRFVTVSELIGSIRKN